MSKVRQSTDCLRKLAIDLLAGKDIPANSIQWLWLKNGVIKYMQEGKQLSLDKALGLAVCGSRHVSTQLSLSVRNHYLILSIRNISFNEDISDWERCKRLAPKANNLCNFWDRHRNIYPDENWDLWKCYLHQAWSTGSGVPTTARGLYLVIENNGYSLHGDELIMYKTIQAHRNHEKLVLNQSSWKNSDPINL